MTLPHKIRIKGKTYYEIHWVDNFDDPTQTGECRSHNSKMILLKKGLNKEETLSTLVHELLHALDVEYRVCLPHKTVYKLERALFRFLKLNRCF